MPLPPELGGELARLEQLPLIDWPAASRARLSRLRAVFSAFSAASGPAKAAFAAFRAARGEALERHARFEALHARFLREDKAGWDWRRWPAPFRDPASPAVAEFARAEATEVAFHAFLQFLADAGLAAAQAAARRAGMPVGLITDLAVGTDAAGSDAWSRPTEMLAGLGIGAPPDAFNRNGQDWGLAAFSPAGLAVSGYDGFREMLGAALRHAGGVRIDHVLGLRRLWVIPHGAAATEGAYLGFPETDLLRLVALESARRGAIVLGEDLGTVPPGFRARMRRAGLLGLQVLIFERDRARRIPPPGALAARGGGDEFHPRPAARRRVVERARHRLAGPARADRCGGHEQPARRTRARSGGIVARLPGQRRGIRPAAGTAGGHRRG